MLYLASLQTRINALGRELNRGAEDLSKENRRLSERRTNPRRNGFFEQPACA